MDKLTAQLNALLKKAYAPYSSVHVAAIAIDADGKLYEGVNVENSVYPVGVCAERNAMHHAVASFGPKLHLNEVHIISNINDFLPPCGMCLQVMSEFMSANGKVVLHKTNSVETKNYTFSELLPAAVTKDSFHFDDK